MCLWNQSANFLSDGSLIVSKAQSRQLEEYLSRINCTNIQLSLRSLLVFLNYLVHAACVQSIRDISVINPTVSICTVQCLQSIQGKQLSANPHCRKVSQDMLITCLQCWRNPEEEKAWKKIITENALSSEGRKEDKSTFRI